MEAFVRKQLDALESSDQEKQNKAIEKIYNLVPKKNQEKELIWALLNHVIESVSQLQFNAWRVRLTKKVAEISKDGPSVAAGLFVRSLLMRNPQAGELHEKTIETLIVSLLNQSLGNENIKNGREVAVSLFAVRYGISSVTRLFNTLDVLIADKNLLEADRTSLLMLSTMGKASHKVQTIQILFDLLVEVMKSSKPGDVLPMQALLNVLSLALKDEKSRDGAFTFIATLAETCRSGFLPLVPRIISTLLTCLEQPTPKLFVCLTILTSIYGPSTGLQNHLFNIWSALQQPLHEQIYNNEANLFLAEVVRKCGYLTKHEVLLHVSREICDLALRYPENQSSHVVVAALLAAQNELAPPPVHIARTICSMYPASPVAPLLQSLADNLARPRIQDIASNYLRSTMKNQNFVFKEHLNGEEHHVHFEEQAHHRSSDDPPPDLDVNFTEDEMEEDEENPTHFGNTEPLNPKSTLFDEKPIIQINLTEDEMEEVEQPETSKAVKKIKKRKRNKEDLRNDGNQSDDSDVVNEQGKSRKTIDIDLTEDEMEETEEHLREQKPKKLTKRSDKKDKPIPVLDVTLSEDEMELGEEASTKAGERRPSAFMLRVQAKLKQKDVERRRAETAKKKNEEQNVVEAVLGANEPTVEEIMSTFCPD